MNMPSSQQPGLLAYAAAMFLGACSSAPTHYHSLTPIHQTIGPSSPDTIVCKFDGTGPTSPEPEPTGTVLLAHLAVPVEAVSRKASSSVLVVTQDHHLEYRIVSTGLETPEKIEILTGLKENDLVVIGNHTQLRQGQQVEPKLIQQTAAVE